ncbi:MAG TPA: hypothetical protein VK509_23360 [Polyangiales bacterium]|nr:hypothetical protein [Polyangiales bacterium]
MGLKQSIDAIGLIVEKQYPGWGPFLQVATGHYHRLRGEAERALQAYDRALAACEPGAHGAWAPAASARVEALLALQRHEPALEAAERGFAQCQRLELGALSEIEAARVLALAEAAVGRTGAAIDRIEHALERCAEHAIVGVRLGVLHEARARVALAADDRIGFASAAARTADVYRAGRNPALIAKYERLMDSARGVAVSFAAELAPAVEVSAGSGVQTADSFHTVLVQCPDAKARDASALRLLCEHSGARAGFLYALDKNGVLSLRSALPDGEPPAELESALAAYLQAERDDTSDVTVTCFDEAAQDAELASVLDYQPVVLWHAADGERRITGIAALLCERAQSEMPGWELLSAVGKALVDVSEPVLSIID